MRAAIALVLAAAATAQAQKPDLSKQPPLARAAAWQAPVPTLATTSAGPRVVVLPQHQLPVVHLLVTIPAGSALDPPDRPGLAAAVAGMLQDGGAGARTSPEVARAFSDLGTELEEHVDTDQVQLSLTVLSRNLDAAIALLQDLVTRPRFDADDWKRAQARRLDEIRRRADEPERLADDLFNRVLYGDHPYGHSSLGSAAAVGAITPAELRAFFGKYYAPSRLTYIFVGDTSDAAVRKHFIADVVTAAAPSWPAPPPVPVARAPRVVLVDRPGAPQSQIRVGHLGAARATSDFAALSLLETVLGGSFTSRLNQNLREKHGYTYGARASFDLRTVPGPFVAAAGVRTDATAPALKEMVAEIAGMRAPLSADELQKGRALVMHGIVEAFGDGNEAGAYLADLVAHRLSLDGWAKLPSELAALDIPALGRAAARYLRPDELTILVVGDRKAIEPSLRALPFVKSLEIMTP